MKIFVLLPSYRRANDLSRCFESLRLQIRCADAILVVVRVGDVETLDVAHSWAIELPIEIVEVGEPGQVQALNAGLARCRSDIVAITDDDAAPRPDWLTRIEGYFTADPRIGGVGGRDWVHQDGAVQLGEKAVVGTILPFGRTVGNHHLGAGAARDVDVLKGANFAFRMAAIRPIGFDVRLRGQGAQVHNDMLASLAVKKAGWRLVYDPAVAVDHYPAPRFDRDGRGVFDVQATADRAYNFRLALREITPAWRRWAAYIWHEVVGTRDEPGVLNLVRMLARRDPHAWQRFRAAHLAESYPD